jgi:hypothetical protein
MTVSGRFFDPFNPRPEDVDLGDVAHALGIIPRFNGHTTRPIPVAEHLMRVARIIRRLGGDSLAVLMGLLHDSGEAYCGDIVRPLKDDRAKSIEAGVLEAILAHACVRFDVEHAAERWAMVKLADDIALFFEAMLWQPGAERWAPSVVGEIVVDLWTFLPDVAPRPGEDWLSEVRAVANHANCEAAS